MNEVVIIQIFSCWVMTGMIWMVQGLVYPQFQRVGEAEFKNYHQFHLRRITWIVAPVMVAELVSGFWLLALNQSIFYFLNLTTIIMLWILTALLNVPSHNRLAFDFEQKKQLTLIWLNWPRTLLWTFRSAFWIWMLLDAQQMGSFT